MLFVHLPCYRVKQLGHDIFLCAVGLLTPARPTITSSTTSRHAERSLRFWCIFCTTYTQHGIRLAIVTDQ